MLVAVRAFEPAEVVASVGRHTPVERYYSVNQEGLSATLVDVTDHRARKTIQFDAMTQSNAELVQSILIPFAAALTEPQQACQATVVVDGALASRQSVLFGKEDGLVQSALVLLRQQPVVDTIFLSAVTLVDGNRFEDVLDPSVAHSPDEEPTVMEDTKDQFTSIESAHYEQLTSEATVDRLLSFLQSRVSATRHQVYSIIVTFSDPEAMPNTTMQFVSLAVNEVARDMKSTRHCIATAASLIATNAPVQSFNGTKLSFLLKPALLGHQPGAYVACFSPISTTSAAEQERETFKEAFCIAQTLSRVFDARAGLFNSAEPVPSAVPKESNSVEWKRPARSLPRHLNASAPATTERPSSSSSSSPSSPVTQRASALTTDGVSPPPHPPHRQPGAVSDETCHTPDHEPCITARAYSPASADEMLQERVRQLERENSRLRAAQLYPSQRDSTTSQRSDASATARPSIDGGGVDLRSLVEMIQQQQAEIKQHVAHEERYRQRILELEESLRARSEQVTLLTGALQERDAEPKLLVGYPRGVSSSDTTRHRAEEDERRSASAHSGEHSTLAQEVRHMQRELERERDLRLRAESGATEQSKSAVEEVRRAFASQVTALQDEIQHFRSQFTAMQEQAGSQAAPSPVVTSKPRRAPQQQRLVSPRSDAGGRASPISVTNRTARSSASTRTMTPAVPSYEDFMRDDPQYRMRHSSTPRPRPKS